MTLLRRLAIPVALLGVALGGAASLRADGFLHGGHGHVSRQPPRFYHYPGGPDLVEVTPNWAWIYPDGGFTAYAGLPGSGIPMRSDYSSPIWVAPPRVNAAGVIQKLDQLGVPLIAPEPVFLGKNPRAHENIKLPVPKDWVVPGEPNKDADKPAGDLNPDR